ncbi:hypothetical protein V2J09_012516 [Rumex salicifolius]
MTLISTLFKSPHLSRAAATSATTIFAGIFATILIFQLHPVNSLGADSTIAAVYSTNTICGIVAGESNRRIECFNDGRRVFVRPNISYDSIAGGRSFFCGLRSGGYSLLCWDTAAQNGTFFPKRIYFSSTAKLREISIGDDQVCAITNSTNGVACWRGISGIQPPVALNGFQSISSGLGFSCGILVNSTSISTNNGGRVLCWGSNSTIARAIQDQFGNSSMSKIVAGGSHVCGLKSSDGSLVCKGSNSSGQLGFSSDESFSQLALGFNFSCGIRALNRTVACWGGGVQYSSNSTTGISFELITAGSDFVCGLISNNFSVICWGPGWPGNDLNLSMILPGPCVQSSCQCGVYPESQKLCSGSGQICSPCSILFSPPSQNSSPSSSSSPSRPLRRGLLAFAIVGSVGALAGICTIIYCLYMGTICGRKKIHNSVQPQISRGGSNGGRFSTHSPPSRSLTIRRQASRAMRRQRSGTSSMKHPDTAEEFTFSELANATENFSTENKIGAGSFGVVYKGKLSDGREVAIKRGETGPKIKKFQEKENAFESELSFLSRLHHKHLVRLVGFCEERDERLLVYDFMKNGALYDHLHDKKNMEKATSLVSSWKMRIKIALDASRGIEYLHNYAVPPIIHRDIKSSNILLDATWTARVSDFGLSLMGPEIDSDSRPLKAAGTVGYIDPEYYGLNVLTAKSDVYGFGVVLLELLTGKKAIFRGDEEDGGDPTSVVDFAVPAIMAGDLARILDPRAGPLISNESEAVELVAYTAMHCVHLEGKDRLTMTDVVANLERALTLCEESRGSMSSASISIGSD